MVQATCPPRATAAPTTSSPAWAAALTPEFRVNGRVGVQYVEYPNARAAVPAFRTSNTSPYADANASWEYLQNSTVQLGVRHVRTTTDVATSVDAEATSVYSSLNHEFNPDLRGSLLANYQLSQYRRTASTLTWLTTSLASESIWSGASISSCLWKADITMTGRTLTSLAAATTATGFILA